MSRGITSVPLKKLFTLAPQHVPTRGHSWKLVKPHSSTDATGGTAYHTNQFRCQLCERVQEPVGQDSDLQDGFLYGLMVRVTPWLYNVRTYVMSHSTRQRQQQQMLISLVQPYQVSYQVSYYLCLLTLLIK